MFVVFLFGTISVASADQGAYGTVWAWADGENDCYVDNAVVTIYNALGQQVAQTTASICGYYTVSLSTGYYRAVVSGTYNERQKNNCNTIVDYEHVGGEKWFTVGFSWVFVDIKCL
jgi:hypothetical protein